MNAPADPTEVFFEPSHASREMLARLGLAHNPFTALVVPRPIGWISTRAPDGVANLAPFSFFNAVSQRPPMVMFCCTGHTPQTNKDSLDIVRETGEFVANLATWDLRWQMNMSATPAPRAVDEFAAAGLTQAECRIVRAPRVAEAPVSLECTLIQTLDLPMDEATGARNTAAFGRVVGVHIDRRLIVDGRVDIRAARPIARLGYHDYAELGPMFEMPKPEWPLQAAACGPLGPSSG